MRVVTVLVVIFIAHFGVVIAKSVNSNCKRSNVGYTQEEIADYQGYDDLKTAAVVQDIDNTGFSEGSGLRSIAQGSAERANTAVAKQQAAAVQAAYIVQTTLAQSAIQAAATANAALAGKEVLLENLERQSLDAISSVDREVEQLEISKSAAIRARASAQQAAAHVAALTAALNTAQILVDKAERAAVDAEAELASQTAMVGKAQGYLNSVASKFAAAQIDFEATKESAAKATASAEEAQDNAEAAGLHASVKLHEAAQLTKGGLTVSHV